MPTPKLFKNISSKSTTDTVPARPTRHQFLRNQFSLAGEMTDDRRVGRVSTVLSKEILLQLYH